MCFPVVLVSLIRRTCLTEHQFIDDVGLCSGNGLHIIHMFGLMHIASTSGHRRKSVRSVSVYYPSGTTDEVVRDSDPCADSLCSRGIYDHCTLG